MRSRLDPSTFVRSRSAQWAEDASLGRRRANTARRSYLLEQLFPNSRGFRFLMALTKTLGSKYAWVIAAAGFLTQVICLSILTSWNMNIIYAAEDFGVAVTALAIVSSCTGITYGGAGIIWGWLSDKVGIRLELTIAGGLAGIFAILLGTMTSNVASVAIIYSIATGCIAGLSTSIIPKMLSTWFDASMRGKAWPIVTIGGSATGMVMGVVGPILITNFTWRGFYVAIGILALVLTVLIWLMVRDSPASIGVRPFGAPEGQAVAAEEPAKADKSAIAKVAKMPITWKAGLVDICWQLWFSSNSMFVLANVADLGFSVAVVGLCMTVQRLCAILGILVFPSLSDKIIRKYIFAFMTVAVGLVYFAMYLVFTPGTPVIVIYLLIGLSGFFGASPSLLQACLSECFPPELRGTGAGFCTTLSLVGSFAGPLLASATVTALGGGLSNFVWFCGGISIVCGILILLLMPKTGGKIGDPWVNKEREALKEGKESI